MNFIKDSQSTKEGGFLAPKKEGSRFSYNNILMIVGIVFLVAAAFGSLFLFFTNKNLAGKIGEVKAQIDQYENSRDSNLESNILNLDEKINIFSNLLGNHLYFQKFTEWLKLSVASGVKFKSAKADFSSGDFKATIEAAAIGYVNAARQLAIFSNSDIVKSYNISKVNFSDSGEVNFTVNLVLFGSMIK